MCNGTPALDGINTAAWPWRNLGLLVVEKDEYLTVSLLSSRKDISSEDLQGDGP
jgi:hypothetical protein